MLYECKVTQVNDDGIVVTLLSGQSKTLPYKPGRFTGQLAHIDIDKHGNASWATAT